MDPMGLLRKLALFGEDPPVMPTTTPNCGQLNVTPVAQRDPAANQTCNAYWDAVASYNSRSMRNLAIGAVAAFFVFRRK